MLKSKGSPAAYRVKGACLLGLAMTLARKKANCGGHSEPKLGALDHSEETFYRSKPVGFRASLAATVASGIASTTNYKGPYRYTVVTTQATQHSFLHSYSLYLPYTTYE